MTESTDKLSEAEARYAECRQKMHQRNKELAEVRQRLSAAQEDHAQALNALELLRRRQVRQEIER